MNNKINFSETKLNKLRNNILEFIFCEPVPTFVELLENKKIEPFQLCEDYEDYSFDSLMSKIDSNVCEFNSHFNAINASEDNLLYATRVCAEFGTNETIIMALHNMDEIVSQSFIDNEDIISLEILPCETDDFEKVRKRLLSIILDSEMKTEIDLLVNALIQAKENNVPTLYIYNN